MKRRYYILGTMVIFSVAACGEASRSTRQDLPCVPSSMAAASDVPRCDALADGSAPGITDPNKPQSPPTAAEPPSPPDIEPPIVVADPIITTPESPPPNTVANPPSIPDFKFPTAHTDPSSTIPKSPTEKATASSASETINYNSLKSLREKLGDQETSNDPANPLFSGKKNGKGIPIGPLPGVK